MVNNDEKGSKTMIDVLRRVSLFEQLNDQELELLLQRFTRQKVPAQTILFHEKDPGDSFIVVVKGSVKIFTKSNNGEEKILSIFKAGDSFGELSLIDNKPRSATAQTLEETQLLVLTESDFMDLLRTNFSITKAIMVELCERIRVTNQQVSDLTFLDARTRVIKNIILLANKHGKRIGNLVSINVPLNYEELSQMASVQKKDLIDVVNDLVDRQILRIYYNAYELNLAKLRA